MEEAPPPTNGMKQHGESTRKIQNNEQLTVEEQACVIETPKVRNAKKLCQQVGDQYTYQNNNAMVDYFNTDGYVTVQAVTGIKKPENNE